MLFQDYNAKLSDFGLAKDGPEGDKTHVSTRVMGTYGYAAPEYVMTGRFDFIHFCCESTLMLVFLRWHINMYKSHTYILFIMNLKSNIIEFHRAFDIKKRCVQFWSCLARNANGSKING